VTDRLTDAELATFSDKARKDPAAVRLFRELPYMAAYAAHTDMRVERDGPAAAVGAAKDWERHGELQKAFLVRQGLRPEHTLLDYGCGTGRLARKVVPYLQRFRYTGVDVSRLALRAARDLSVAEGWARMGPILAVPPSVTPAARYDYVWAFSVAIHLPAAEWARTVAWCAERMDGRSRFYASYVPERVEARTGLKQFRHTEWTYRSAAASAGLTFDRVVEWEGEQKMALMRL
jgi:SAM-dependent methyltransferase